ncbi:hypothetical protein [Pseudomonas aeruginosa]|uniref:hypothetical protein n=1 Tax=Pseudomonas aeruginosa TaxID=287 RepID=UPI0030F34AE1
MFGCGKWMIDTYPITHLPYCNEIIPSFPIDNEWSNVSVFTALSISEETVPIPDGLVSAFDVYRRMQVDPLISEAKIRTQFPFSIFLLRLPGYAKAA